MNLVAVYGFHAIGHHLSSLNTKIDCLYLSKDRNDKRIQVLEATALSAGCSVERVTRPTLDRMSGGGRHQGAILMCEPYQPASERELDLRWPKLDNPLILALDGVEDPRNLGACLRSADAAGVDMVLLPRSRTAPLSDVAFKAASGALESLMIIHVANLVRRLDWLRKMNVWIIGTDERSEINYVNVDLTKPVAIVMGGEQRGLRRLTKDKCDYLVSFPMHGSVLSLNVSVATGIVLYECIRQRNMQNS